MQKYGVNLKTFLGLVMPHQCCQAVTKLILGWSVGGIFGQETPNLNSTTILYDKRTGTWEPRNREDLQETKNSWIYTCILLI